jgi:glycosyltransferase involved in cell wall biosynthesis
MVRQMAVARAMPPLWVSELELVDPPPRLVAGAVPRGIEDRSLRHYPRARLLVRLQGEPIGVMSVNLTRGEAPIDAVLAEAHELFAPAIRRQLGPDWRRQLERPLPVISREFSAVQDGSDLPGVSVVIGTRNRPQHVANCVSRVLKADYTGPLEVIVVDNGADSSTTCDLLAAEFGRDERVRYIHETAPGLSRARNIGLRAASHPITAFLSDDIQVDSLWLLALVRAFGRSHDVRCVVGYCPPLYLDLEGQLVFEKLMGWGWRLGFEPRLVGPQMAADRLFPYRVGLGVGANMSFDTQYFKALGGFDETLGPGTLARGGEDLDAPVRVLLDQQTCVYEPAAIGWHADRYDDRSFPAHMYAYGVGLTAFLAKHLFDRTTRWGVVKRMPFGARFLLAPEVLPDSASRLDEVPVRFVYLMANHLGRLAGPVLWWRSRLALGRRQAPQPTV